MAYEWQRYLRIGVLSVTGALLIGCAASVARFSAEVAPRALPPDLEVQRIAVMDFRGPDGRQVSRDLEADLVNHEFNGQPYFTIVDRGTHSARKLMSEYARGLRGEINPREVARFGREIGAQAILFGTVTTDGIAASHHSGVVTRCTAKDAIGLCTKFVRVPTTCVVHQARFDVLTRLVDVETEQVVYEKRHIGRAKGDSCSGPMPLNIDLLASARSQALSQVASDIAPSNVTLNVALKSDAKGLSAAQTKRFLGAVAFAKVGRMGHACQIWRSINNSGSAGNVAVAYDLAVCAEANGRLSEALEMYRHADKLLTRPDSDIDASLRRVQTEISQRHRIAAGVAH
jgi:hypothetical protein